MAHIQLLSLIVFLENVILVRGHHRHKVITQVWRSEKLATGSGNLLEVSVHILVPVVFIHIINLEKLD